ncbi:hypothetical protein [Pantoea sp. BAV 3049]|uniref:hypothetical protein n=1 Tax=Pantoea sp. BAV 3049 TaxID=2654188 RepID=UPI00131BAB47|nr:hypothetical protein [Pantoea sp. BAV 3049]
MKTQPVRHSLLVLLLSIAGLPLAHAECSVQLSDAVIDYGSQTRGDLLQQNGNELTAAELSLGEERIIDVNITCDRPAPLSLQFIAPARDSQSYSFGRSGKAVLKLYDASVDNQPAEIASNLAGTDRSQAIILAADKRLTFWREGTRLSGSSLRAKVAISTYLPAGQTRVSDRQSWQLNGNFIVSDTE